MDSGIRRRKDAKESSSSRHQRCHSESRRRSDSRSSPVGYSHEDFGMGIKSPSTSTFDPLDQKFFDILEARFYHLAQRDGYAMERRLEEKYAIEGLGIPDLVPDLDLNSEEDMDIWAANRFLNRPGVVLQHCVLGSNFWEIIFKTIPAWCDMNNYIFAWGNIWTKEILIDRHTRPYGFPPVLWLSLGKGKCVMPDYEHEDPLCKWMFITCTPDNTLSIMCTPGDNGNMDWCIRGISDGYIKSVYRKPRRVFPVARKKEEQDEFDTENSGASRTNGI